MTLFIGEALWVVPESFAFRCGDRLVSTGDSTTRVFLDCGKPTSKEVTQVERGVGVDASGNRVRTFKKVERWYYNCGDAGLLYVLTFEGGIMTDEDTEGRGTGKSNCLGR